MKESKVKVNEIYSSNHSGDFIVLKPMGTMNKNMTYLVRFLKTGYETITRYDSILNGTVKDPYFPRIYGVGYFGEPGSYTEEAMKEAKDEEKPSSNTGNDTGKTEDSSTTTE